MIITNQKFSSFLTLLVLVVALLLMQWPGVIGSYWKNRANLYVVNLLSGGTQDASRDIPTCLSKIPTGVESSADDLYDYMAHLGALNPTMFTRQAGIALAVSGRLGEGEELLAQAAGPSASYWRIKTLVADGDIVGAAQEIKRGSQWMTVQLLIQRGWLSYERGETENARVCFELATAIEPDDCAALTARGRMYQSSGAYELALSDYAKSIGNCPQDDAAYLFRGQTLVANGAPSTKIEDDFRRAVELAPENFDAVLQWAYWLRDQGNEDAATESFLKAAELAPWAHEPVLALASSWCSSPDLALKVIPMLEKLDSGADKGNDQIQAYLIRCREAAGGQ